MSSDRNSDERPKLAFYDKGPGPGGYLLPPLIGRRKHAPTHRINPEYSMAPLTGSSFVSRNSGPGPAQYLVEKGLKANGKFLGYEFTMRMKCPLQDKTSFVPPPTKYVLPPTDRYRQKPPAWVIGLRTPLLMKKVSPGPNTYLLPPAIGPKIPDKLAAAECTLKGDRKGKLPIISPGPIYDVGRPDVIKPRSAAFTMRIKYPHLTSGHYEASPASYEAELPKCPCKVTKGPHLGIRYNDFTGIFRTPCDRMNLHSLGD